MEEYLGEKSVLAIGGTWIATRDDIAAGRWNIIRDNCRNALAVVEGLKAATHMSR
jgi:2-dehydro-3-deoxyphosphogluconate aldolase/(4S)-4-hydroxy-2-oxoglutarate aldolase